MDREDIRKALIKRYLLVLAPAAAVLMAWAGYRNLIQLPPPLMPEVVGPAAFIAALALALALPLLGRDRFVKRVASSTFVPVDDFLAFEKANMTVGLSSAYCAAAAYVCSAGQFHFGGAFLAALYAAYYYFPTRTRMAHEMRLFRVPDPAGK